jgi:hypothetical protein
MLDFLLFRKMLTPILIQALFWLGFAMCLMGGFYNVTHHALLHGLQILLIGPILVRIFCEILIVFFRINETLTEIKNSVQEKR